MPRRDWLWSPRRIVAVFAAVALVPAAALGWLSWHLLKQDRALESQRLRERLEYAADRAGASLGRRLAETEERLAELATVPDTQVAGRAAELGNRLTADALIAVLRSDAVESYPAARLLYYPFLPASKDPAATVFTHGEVLEFQQKDHAKAIAAFRELSRSPDRSVRAGALLRLARNLHKAGDVQAALAVYEDLARMRSAFVGGLPAELLARRARCLLLEELKDFANLRREAAALYHDLDGGRWRLSRASYRFYAQEARLRLDFDSQAQAAIAVREQEGLALATGVESAWDQWQAIRRGEGHPAGRKSVLAFDRVVLVAWRSGPQRMAVLVGGPRFLEQAWLPALAPLLESSTVQVTLTDADGRPVVGQASGAARLHALRSPADTGLPWTLHAASVDPAAGLAELAARRRLLMAGLAMMAVVVLAGSYFTARAVTRELRLARLQSDFVSAVSHDFLTPLTSMRQLADTFVRGRMAGEEQRQQYYEVLARQTERLYRLVQGLLDFGRMEAGAHEYRFELLDAAALVRDVVAEFQQEVAARDFRLELTAPDSELIVRGDSDALRRALWNLLDNAVKYSPHCRTVSVEVTGEGQGLSVRVRDRGLGISPEEQKAIFKKFVRGASSKAAGVKGTGLGLAMVHHIVRAHRGRVLVESQPEGGSTFTITLPGVTSDK